MHTLDLKKTAGYNLCKLIKFALETEQMQPAQQPAQPVNSQATLPAQPLQAMGTPTKPQVSGIVTNGTQPAPKGGGIKGSAGIAPKIINPYLNFKLQNQA